jgi:hypothetical protein
MIVLTVVVAVEHLDGSAQMARYVDRSGKKKWLPYIFAERSGEQVTLDERGDQLIYVSVQLVYQLFTMYYSQ